MQLASNGFNLSRVLAAERFLMAMQTRARAGRTALSGAACDEVCTLLDETGQPLGTVVNAVGTPHLGPNEETVFLRRDN